MVIPDGQVDFHFRGEGGSVRDPLSSNILTLNVSRQLFSSEKNALLIISAFRNVVPGKYQHERTIKQAKQI